MKKTFFYGYILAVIIQIVSFVGFTQAVDPFPGSSQGPNGPNNFQGGSMPDDVKQQAAKNQQAAMTENEKKARAQKYDKCMVDNGGAGNEAYCNCVADGGVKLNTNVPFVGRCINKDGANAGSGSTTSTVFGDLVGGLSKMVVTAILIVSFMFIIIGGVQWASGNPKEGKAKIIKVVIGLAILGASGAILRLINPNFFK